MIHRYFIDIAFKGTEYHGWQKQPNAISVQQKIEEALAILLRQHVDTVGCGRTDTGVHASQLYVQFDTSTDVSGDKFLWNLNSLLPYDIVVLRIIKVEKDAHARFDATSRTYKYRLGFKKNPFENEISAIFPKILDFELMNEACKELVKHNDFAAFSKSGAEHHTSLCEISGAIWKQEGDIWVFTITANRFLRNMVRAIVGTLVEVGLKKINLSQFNKIIDSKNRSNAGTSVPAKGLFLHEVEYPYIKKR
ncbi:MAG: tRNA pseudouridine38-40 synthase [Sphingobacteriales bacterium]